MINTSVSKNEHTIQSGVVEYSIGFPFYFNPDRTPQFLVKIGDEELRFNHNFELSEDRGSVVLRPTEEESWTLEGPEDFSWMAKWDGKKMLIERVVPFVQDSDYQLGRISSEQIERDFDLSVMRDQILADRINEHIEDTQDEIDALHSRIDFVQEEHESDITAVYSRIDSVREEHESDIAAIDSRIDAIQEEHASDMATVDSQLSTKAVKADVDAEFATVNANLATKATKAELETAKSTLSAGLERNEQAIQDTRDDMNAKDSQLEATLNSHTGELTTLRTQVSGIESKIPESASESNQLATKEDLGDSLPDQTDNAGKFLTTDGTTASWSDKVIVNTATGTNAITIGGTASDKTEAVNIGAGSQAKGSGGIAIGIEAVNNGAGVVIGQRASAGVIGRVAIGYGAEASGSYSIAIGDSVTATKTSSLAIGGHATANGAIQLGHGTNNETGTFCVGNYYNNSTVNYKLLDADGTIPAERMSATAGTTGQVLTKTDTGMEWQDASGGTSVTIRTWA